MVEILTHMAKTGNKKPMLRKVLVATAVALGLLAISLYAWISLLPDPGELAHKFPVVEYDAATQKATVRLEAKRPPSWVSVQDVSRLAIGAIVVSEDWAFYQHEGFDANQIQKVIERGIKTRKLRRGASTITQQVIKNVYLSPERSLKRKLNELALAVLLERRVSKSRILSIYLNIAEWGKGLYGINQAAHYYFYKHPRNLTAREGAFLAMLLPNPKKYSVSFRERNLTEYAAGIMKSILHKMVQARYMDSQQLDRALNTPMWFEDSNPLWTESSKEEKEQLIDDLKNALNAEAAAAEAEPGPAGDSPIEIEDPELPDETPYEGEEEAVVEPVLDTSGSPDPPAADEALSSD